ncbi:hypothetical protein ACOME3_001168 [Neoechinorhynchus agilis]
MFSFVNSITPNLFRTLRPGISNAQRSMLLHMDSTAVLVCDVQEKFKAHIANVDTMIENCQRAIKCAKIMKLPVIVTEQYPRGLGHTIPELTEILDKNVPIIEKTRFSMAEPKVKQMLADAKISSLIVVGIEAHVCVLQTVLDFLDEDFDVHLPVDSISSRSMQDRKYGLKRARDAGAYLTTLESAIFQLFKDAAHPQFKEAQSLFKTLLPPFKK